ncbi:MAG: N-acetylneuraminate synthase [Flavobacteriia bacterium]|nr:N-acetylneuraminate synthase [Flavobacteriia bacterium]
MDQTYTISEIGINHNGDLKIAKNLIDISKSAGFDCVKFQKRNPNICVPESQKYKLKDTPWGKITYLQYKYKIEFEREEYDEIDYYCKQKQIQWSASPWDIDSAKFLKKYNLPFIKIASASLTDHKLLKYCSLNFNKIIMSTGMSTEEEVDMAYNILSRNCKDIVIMHCNSEYPTPPQNVNLNYIKKLQLKYPNNKIGYSGHEYGLTTTICSVAMGAKYIERHVTLDKTMWGSDHLVSIEPHGMFKLIRGIREIEMSLGSLKKIFTAEEKNKRSTLSKSV